MPRFVAPLSPSLASRSREDLSPSASRPAAAPPSSTSNHRWLPSQLALRRDASPSASHGSLNAAVEMLHDEPASAGLLRPDDAIDVSPEPPNSLNRVYSAPNESTPAAIDEIYDAEDDLSEGELRQIYEEEEIDRFLKVFGAYVNEVRLPEPHAPPTSPTESTNDVLFYAGVSATSPETSLADSAHERDTEDEMDWTPVNVINVSPIPTGRPRRESLAEDVAERVLTFLPPARPSPPPFTLGRLRLSIQRLYLAVEPAYYPFICRMFHLASWQNQRESGTYCAVFWFLWLNNLLLPALLLYMLYTLIRRRLFVYPSLAELRAHRSRVSRAEKFSDAVEARLSASSTVGVKEAWRMFRVVYQSKKGLVETLTPGAKEVKRQLKSKVPGREKKNKNSSDLAADVVDDDKNAAQRDETTILDPTDVPQQVEQDLKRLGLQLINGIADFHERVKNLFLWRRPAASRIYVTIIAFLFVMTLTLPAQYLAKIAYGTIGFVYWHVVPVLMAMPASRIPLPLQDIPTDLDYAMELIAERVAKGLDVKPARRKRRKNKAKSGSQSSLNLLDGAKSSSSLNLVTSEDNDDSPNANDRKRKSDWMRSAVKIATAGKMWADDGKRLIDGLRSTSYPPASNLPLVPPTAFAHANAEARIDKHAFMCQHTKGPGVLTLAPNMLLFATVMHQSAKFSIPLQSIRGVKKTGGFKGLSVRWVDENANERVERFIWVRGRDEAFARMVGASGRGWMRV